MPNKQVWHCAVKNTTTTKTQWFYHLFYDFDNIQLGKGEIAWLVKFMNDRSQSFILRKTNHGYHLIGLTPLDSAKWGLDFADLQHMFPTYHDGQAIRITQKEIGEFIIVASDYSFPYVLNLMKLFIPNYKDKMWLHHSNEIKEQWYVLLYYTTNKKNVKNKEVIASK